MSVIQFIYDSTIQNCPVKRISSNIVQITLEKPVIQEVISDGFYILNENNNSIMGDYSKYKTIYSSSDNDDLVFQLSNNGSVKPMLTGFDVRFSINEGGNLEGNLLQHVINYEDLIIPKIVTNENYEFNAWTPKIPSNGKVAKDEEFVAILRYIPTFNDVKKEKISMIEELYKRAFVENCVVVTLSDNSTLMINNINTDFQMILADAYNNASTMLASNITDAIPFDINGVCQSFSPIDIILIYIQEQSFVIYNRSLKNELIATINRATDEETVNSILYTVDSLDDIALSNFQKSINDGSIVIENLKKLYNINSNIEEDSTEENI